MLIGEVVKKHGIGIDTLRYYDRIGLLTVKRVNNNRFYTDEDMRKLEDILAMKEMMFSLGDIRRILEIDKRIDEGLEKNSIERKDVDILLEEIKSKYEELLEKERQLQKVRMGLESIINKIENFKRRDVCG